MRVRGLAFFLPVVFSVIACFAAGIIGTEPVGAVGSAGKVPAQHQA